MIFSSSSRIRRLWRKLAYRWRIILCALAAAYAFLLLPDGIATRSISNFKQLAMPHKELLHEDVKQEDMLEESMQEGQDENSRDSFGQKVLKRANDQQIKPKIINLPVEKGTKWLLSSQKYGQLWIEYIVGDEEGSLQRKMKANVNREAPSKIILSYDAGHSPANLNGCPDWNCKFTTEREMLGQADAILITKHYSDVFERRRKDQYIIYFSQESPVHSPRPAKDNFFNMSLNFRRDSPASSPYGYTVKLAPESYGKNLTAYEEVIMRKTKPIAWFVSHCATLSEREKFVEELKVHIGVDTYGMCGKLRCERGGACENALDNDYFFYITFENSICKDYITEKLWNQGYQRKIVPLVLKRKIVEPYVPPHSFIAVDDFSSAKEMADYLKYLIDNKTAYMEYFAWRERYAVIFLDGTNHDELERPWGFCQVCRLLWQEPKETHILDDFENWWGKSCESTGELVRKYLTKRTKIVANNPIMPTKR